MKVEKIRLDKMLKWIDLNRLIFILIAVMALSLPFSESIKSISVVLALIVFLIQLYKGDFLLKPSMVHYGFLSFLLSSILSSFFATDLSKSLSGSKDILFFTVPFFVASSINKESQIRTILWCLFISATVSALIGIFHSFESGRPLEIHALGNQNYTAMFFMIILSSMISLVLYSDKETPFKKTILIFLSTIILLASAMTLMRASFLGLFVFLALLSLRRPSRPFFAIILGFILLTLLSLYLDRAMWQKLFSFKSMISRLDIWAEAIRLFKENPVTGVGLNHFEFRFPADHPVEPGNTVYDAHSLYLQVASQMGLIGLISLAIMFAGFIKTFRGFGDLSGFGKAMGYGSIGAFLVISVTGLFDTTLHHEHAMAFTMITGLMFGYFRGRKRENGI